MAPSSCFNQQIDDCAQGRIITSITSNLISSYIQVDYRGVGRERRGTGGTPRCEWLQHVCVCVLGQRKMRFRDCLCSELACVLSNRRLQSTSIHGIMPLTSRLIVDVRQLDWWWVLTVSFPRWLRVTHSSSRMGATSTREFSKVVQEIRSERTDKETNKHKVVCLDFFLRHTHKICFCRRFDLYMTSSESVLF